MPSRVVREGILESEQVQKLLELGGWEAEVFYRRLHQVVDDFGCYSADPRLLRPRMYPLALEKMREANVSRCLAHCEAAGLVRLYSVGAKQYLAVTKFKQRTRAMVRKYPEPPFNPDADVCPTHDGHVSDVCRLDTDTISDTETIPKENTPKPPAGVAGGLSPPAGFDRFWRAYPSGLRKRAKADCLKRWQTAKLEPLADAVLASLEVYTASLQWRKDGGQYVPAPLKWLKDAPWETDPQDLIPANGNGLHDPTADYLQPSPELRALALGDDQP